jgi:hypothetical protein
MAEDLIHKAVHFWGTSEKLTKSMSGQRRLTMSSQQCLSDLAQPVSEKSDALVVHEVQGV